MIRFCTATTRGTFCAKVLAWTKHPDRWSGKCACGLQRRATIAEGAELDVLRERGVIGRE